MKYNYSYMFYSYKYNCKNTDIDFVLAAFYQCFLQSYIFLDSETKTSHDVEATCVLNTFL